jgi:hypothetical protein
MQKYHTDGQGQAIATRCICLKAGETISPALRLSTNSAAQKRKLTIFRIEQSSAAENREFG